MKVVMVSSLDGGAGAARAAARLHDAVAYEGVESALLVQSQRTTHEGVLGPRGKISAGIGLMRPTIEGLPVVRHQKNCDEARLFSSAWLPFSGIVSRINELRPDVVHLHWVCGGTIRLEELKRINAPVVWSMHDNWVFTGGCHVKHGCEGFLASCGNCPLLCSGSPRDLSYHVFRRKQREYRKTPDMTFVGLSSWMTSEARRSALLGDRDIVTIPNPIDTNRFKPVNARVARTVLGVPLDRPVLAFGSLEPQSDRNKGYDLLEETLALLPTDVHLIVFGSNRAVGQSWTISDHSVTSVGTLHDDYSLALVYNAADTVVVPSRQENLSNVIMESLACGTPVAAFDTGGNSDLVDHRDTGYLATPFDTGDLASGIEWLLHAKEDPNSTVSSRAREKVETTFANSVVARQMVDLYHRVVS